MNSKTRLQYAADCWQYSNDAADDGSW